MVNCGDDFLLAFSRILQYPQRFAKADGERSDERHARGQENKRKCYRALYTWFTILMRALR
jgi:hypothetical protein